MDILKLFQYEEKLKFSDIQNSLKIRSNKLAYHLNNLTRKGILKKEGKYYLLSETTECLIPYMAEKNSVMSAILIHIGNNKEVFLISRTKRPFKEMLSMPGGRILAGESIDEAVKRIMLKNKINAKLISIHSVSLEHLIKNNNSNSTHSFLLIFVSATTKDKIELTNIKKNKSKIITSDYKLIKEDLNKSISIKTIITRKF